MVVRGDGGDNDNSDNNVDVRPTPFNPHHTPSSTEILHRHAIVTSKAAVCTACHGPQPFVDEDVFRGCRFGQKIKFQNTSQRKLKAGSSIRLDVNVSGAAYKNSNDALAFPQEPDAIASKRPIRV